MRHCWHVTFLGNSFHKNEADFPELLVSNKSNPPHISQLTPPAMEPLPDTDDKQLQKDHEILKLKGRLGKTTQCYNRQPWMQTKIWKVPLLRKRRLHLHNRESRESRDIVENP